MTNTNREEWEISLTTQATDYLNLYGELSEELADRLLALIERYREALTDIAANDKTTGNGWADRNLLRGIASCALQSPTQAPLQEGER